MLGSEFWEEEFQALLQLVKSFILEVWELRKQELYGSQPGAVWPQFSAGNLESTSSPTGKSQGKFGGKFSDVNIYTCDVCVQLCDSVHVSGCVAHGLRATATN